MLLKDMIAAAQKKVDGVGDPGDDAEKKAAKTVAEAELSALKSVEKEGYTFTQNDLNDVDRKAKVAAGNTTQRMEKLFGTSLDNVETVLANLVEQSLGITGDSGATGEGEGAGAGAGEFDANVLARVTSELKKRDETIGTLKQGQTDFQRMYYEREVKDSLAEQFGSLGLVNEFRPAAETYADKVVGYSDLVDKKMNGEAVTNEEIKAKAEAVKSASRPWFAAPPNPDYPGIPPAPNGDPVVPLTDEQRANKSDAVF